MPDIAFLKVDLLKISSAGFKRLFKTGFILTSLRADSEEHRQQIEKVMDGQLADQAAHQQHFDEKPRQE